MTVEIWRDAASLTHACDAALTAANGLLGTLEADTVHSVEATLETYNKMLIAVDSENGWASLMFEVSPDAAVREAADGCKQRLAKFGNDVMLNRGVYDTMSAVDVSHASAEAQRAHRLILREFRRSGVAQDDATRDRLRAIHERMVVLGQEYSRNVAGDVRRIEVLAKDLEGLPADWIAERRPAADAPFVVTTDYPDYIPFLTYSRSEAARKRLATTFAQRGYPANAEVLKETLGLRWEYARILGFGSWAEYAAEDKMVKTAGTIEGFLKELTGIARPRSDQDTRELFERKQQDDPKSTGFAVWDRFFYLSQVREEKYGFDSQEVRQYFSYTRVKDGVLGTYAELFGLEFVKRDVPTWHSDVESFMLRRDGRDVGIFYLDMHPRTDKFKHAAMFPIQTGLAGGRLPMASLVCNFSSPNDGGEALMEHGDVETFFHEFGHLLHHLLANGAHYTNLGGISVEWDFVEAPSQILEEWAWSHEVLARFAKHQKTGAVIPKDLVDRMRRSEEFGKGAETMRQLFFAAYSYFLHAKDPSALDIEAFTDEVFKTYSPYARLEGDRLYANFGHLMGYTSAYYTYQWSLVIAKDLFTRFEAAGLMDKATAKAYADEILAPGGTADAADLVKNFLGRSYNLEAYRHWLTK